MNTKAEIKAAAAKRFKTKEIVIDGAVKVTLREMSTADRNALNARLFVCDESGNPQDKDGSWTYRGGIYITEEWLAATMTPAHTVEDLLDPSWPESLKLELRREAMALNGITLKDAVGNS
jgi:hypothetical protein